MLPRALRRVPHPSRERCGHVRCAKLARRHPGHGKDTLLAPYNDLGAVEALLQEHDGQVAAIIVEPVAGNMGCIPRNLDSWKD